MNEVCFVNAFEDSISFEIWLNLDGGEGGVGNRGKPYIKNSRKNIRIFGL